MKRVVLALLVVCIFSGAALAYTPERNLRTFDATLKKDLLEMLRAWQVVGDNADWIIVGVVYFAVKLKLYLP